MTNQDAGLIAEARELATSYEAKGRLLGAELLTALADRLEALSQPSPAPQGEATPEMLAAGLDQLFDYLNDATDTRKAEDTIADIWKAMLAASQPSRGEG